MGYAFKRGTPFWEKVDIQGAEDCWMWLAGKGSHGYGQHYMPGRIQVLAHRYAYQDKCGPIPDGLTIDHLCKVRLCCNPAHMEIVTIAENSRRGERNRKTRSGRARPELTSRTECVNGHPFTGDNFRWVGNARICRICTTERTRAFRARQRDSQGTSRGDGGRQPRSEA